MPIEQFALAWGNCIPCVQARLLKALSDYNLAMSEQVVETEYGWTPSLCALGEPVEWVCRHIHETKEEAEACLLEALAAGRGRFPMR